MEIWKNENDGKTQHQVALAERETGFWFMSFHSTKLLFLIVLGRKLGQLIKSLLEDVRFRILYPKEERKTRERQILNGTF